MPLRSLLVCLACLGKSEHRLDDSSNSSRIDQCAHPDQLIPVGIDDKPDRAHTMRLRLFRRGRTSDGEKHSSFFQHHPGSLQYFAAYRLEDDIDIMNHVLKARGGIIDSLVGPEIAEEVAIARRRSPNDKCISPASKLDGKDPNSSCCTVDQDGLPCSKACIIKERLPGREC